MKPEYNRELYRINKNLDENIQKDQILKELTTLRDSLLENIQNNSHNRGDIIEGVSGVELALLQIRELFDIRQEEIDIAQEYKLEKLSALPNDKSQVTAIKRGISK